MSNFPPPPPTFGNDPGYGAMPPGYVAKRPGKLTAAAVLAFVASAFHLLVGLVLLAVSEEDIADDVTMANVKLVAILLLVIAGIYIWGGVAALTGKDGRPLVVGAGLAIVINIVSLVLNKGEGFSPISFVFPALIAAFTLQKESKDWITSKGGKTF